MSFSYGDLGQYNAGKPECGDFADHPSIHYGFFYVMPIMTIFAIIVNGFIMYILLIKNKKLLSQSQHVYVLGSAITNLCVAIGCNIISWIDSLLLPCMYLGAVPCFAYNIFNFAGGYQIMTNVCLVCYDRWRLVRLGAAYDHPKEVLRAKWLLLGTSVLNFGLFIVPELVVPALTGVMFRVDIVCGAAQSQFVPQLHIDVGYFMGYFMIVVPWTIITMFTMKTVWKLCSHNQTSPANSQVADRRKMLRASFVMFGMVIVLLATFGPLALGFILLDAAPDAISWYQVQCLLYVQFLSPALEPFAFAATLPKLRKSARDTFVGRQLSWVSSKLGGLTHAVWSNAKTTTVKVSRITPHH